MRHEKISRSLLRIYLTFTAYMLITFPPTFSCVHLRNINILEVSLADVRVYDRAPKSCFRWLKHCSRCILALDPSNNGLLGEVHIIFLYVQLTMYNLKRKQSPISPYMCFAFRPATCALLYVFVKCLCRTR